MRYVVVLVSLFIFKESSAQFNYHELSRKAVYFGIHMGVNVADFKVIRQPYSPDIDSIKTVRPRIGPGFNLGIICNYQFHKYFDLRFIPTLSFSDKALQYTQVKNSVVKKDISSIYLDFPLLLRFKSEPIKDFRIYVIAGMRYDFDLASNQRVRRDNTIVKLRRHDVAAEYGIGFMVYFPYFILSPEFKMSHGVMNVHFPTEGLLYSRVLQKLYSRTFTLSINLEG